MALANISRVFTKTRDLYESIFLNLIIKYVYSVSFLFFSSFLSARPLRIVIMTAYVYKQDIVVAFKIKKHPITVSQAECKVIVKITMKLVRSERRVKRVRFESFNFFSKILFNAKRHLF